MSAVKDVNNNQLQKSGLWLIDTGSFYEFVIVKLAY